MRPQSDEQEKSRRPSYLVEGHFDISKANIVERDHNNVDDGEWEDVIGDLPVPFERSEQ